MPRGDRTGPMGMGPMTGRAAGYCAGNNVPGFMNAGYGGGFGRGRGRGGGRGRGFGRGLGWWGQPGWAGVGLPVAPVGVTDAPATEQELAILRQQAEQLAEALGAVKNRLDELKAEPSSKKK